MRLHQFPSGSRRSSRASVLALLVVGTLWNPSTHAYKATIERDAFGVPPIYGETDADMAFGLASSIRTANSFAAKPPKTTE